MPALSGHNASITVSGTEMHSHHYSVEWRVQDFDVSTFENQGYGTYATGLKDADISFDAFYDPDDDPFGAGGPTMAPGSTHAITIELTKGVGSRIWLLPVVLVISVRQETGVRDTVHYSVTGKITDDGTTDTPVEPPTS